MELYSAYEKYRSAGRELWKAAYREAKKHAGKLSGKTAEEKIIIAQLADLLSFAFPSEHYPIERLYAARLFFRRGRMGIVLAGDGTVFVGHLLDKPTPEVIHEIYAPADLGRRNRVKVLSCLKKLGDDRLDTFLKACMLGCDRTVAIYGWGSYFEDREIASDVDFLLIHDSKEPRATIYNTNVAILCRNMFGVKYPDSANITFMSEESIRCPQADRWTLYNIKHNSVLLCGRPVDVGEVEYSRDMADGYMASTKRHLENAFNYLRTGDREMAGRCLSKAILVVTRGLAWREGYTGGSFVEAAETIRGSPFYRTALLGLALRDSGRARVLINKIERIAPRVSKEILSALRDAQWKKKE